MIRELSSYPQLYFGTNPDNLPQGFISHTYKHISERFVGITMDDVKNAYAASEIVKKEFSGLSLEEMLQPIKDYWFKKQNLLSEIQEAENRESEKNKDLEKVQSFRLQVEETYRKSIEAGKWIGQGYEAEELAPDYAETLHIDVKKQIWREAQRQHREQKKAVGETKSGQVPPMVEFEKHIYARLIMDECIKRKTNQIIG